jgi:DNA-binding NarL/FixJ family response regulator
MIVDDHQVFCEGMAALFNAACDIEVVAVANEGGEAVELARDLHPDVVLLGVNLPNGAAFDVADRISMFCTRTANLFFDDEIHNANVFEALGVPRAGYWTKQAGFDEICEAVRCAADGRPSFCWAVSRRLTFTPAGIRFRPINDSPELKKLSPGQTQLIVYVARGLTLTQCAAKMNTSRSAVDNCMCRLRKKLGVRSTAELVRLAMREGLVR